MKKIIVIVSVIVIAGGAFWGYKAFRGEEGGFSSVTVTKQDIVQKVSATGSLVPLKRIKLQPQSAGEVSSVLVEIADGVKEGEALIKLDAQEVEILVQKALADLETAKSDVALAEAKVDNAAWNLGNVKNSTAENVKKAEADVESAKVTLASKKQDLEDTKTKAASELAQAYEDARDDLNSNYIVGEKGLVELEEIKDDYFYRNDQTSILVGDEIDGARNKLEKAEEDINQAKSSEGTDDTNKALATLSAALEKIKDALTFVRAITKDNPFYKSEVSSTDKSTLDTQKSNVETAIAAVTSAKQNIDSEKIDYEKEINSASSSVASARADLAVGKASLNYVRSQKEEKVAQASSSLTEAQRTLALKESQLEAAKADLAEAQRKLEEKTITAPFAGTITEVNVEKGETAEITAVVVAMIPEKDYKIEADISEVDIGEIEKGDTVKLDFDAFPGEKFKGAVYKIHPAEIVKEGVIYYRIEVVLDRYPEKLRPGLTANLDIITDKKENVLVVPYVAVVREDQQNFVKVVKDGGEVEKRGVVLGIEAETMIEVVEGLSEGEKVVTYEE